MIAPLEFGQWLYELIAQDSAVAALVGEKVFPYTTREPQATPWVVWDGISCEYEPTKDGNDISSASASVMCAEQTYAAALSLAKAVEAAVNGRTSAEGWYMTVGSVRCEYIEQVGYVFTIDINILF